MTDKDPTAELKSLSRQHLCLVWQIAQMGGELSDEDRSESRNQESDCSLTPDGGIP